MNAIRPVCVYGEQVAVDDIGAILDVAEGWSPDARIHLLHPYLEDDEVDETPTGEHPWTTEWTGVAVVVHGAAVLVPIVGEWPFGPDMHADDLDPRTITVPQMIAALRRITVQKRNGRDPNDRFHEEDRSMQRILDILVAHAQADGRSAEIVEECDDGDGTLLCEVAMDEHGLPVLFMESPSGHYDVDVDHETRLAISRVEPLCMTAFSKEMDFDGESVSTVLLSPVRGMENPATLEGKVHDPVEIIRIMSEQAARTALLRTTEEPASTEDAR